MLWSLTLPMSVCSLAEQATVTDVRSEPWVLNTLDGTKINPFANTNTRAIVLIFISNDCPIANAYHPRLKEIEQEYREKGIALFLVHSTADITAKAARDHADEFDLSIPIVLDSDQVVAQRVGAKVTPEAILLPRDEDSAVYRGAIDNLYEGYGKKRRRANKHYLKDGLDQWLAGMDIVVPVTKPIGCYISYVNR